MGFTKQETFDLVFTHLFEQGERAVDEVTLYCRYRDTHGLKCAVGCLIPDSEYTEDMEDCLPYVRSENDLTRLLRNLGHDINLCGDLQSVHDSRQWGIDMHEVLKGLRTVAKIHNLRF